MSQHNELATKLQGRIAKVSIRRFRGLRQIEALELPQLTVLIGANGAGKSTLIRFFEMLGWMLKAQRLQEFVFRYGGGDEQFAHRDFKVFGRVVPQIQTHGVTKERLQQHRAPIL